MLESNQKKIKSLQMGKEMEIDKVESVKEKESLHPFFSRLCFPGCIGEGLMLSVTGGIPRWKTFS